ncbi:MULTISPECIES: hypothetical protein [Bacillus cereus group]|uniref:hypothetical protein n=1 Tax=Bacillus cereus group TaxID=86661 RepID=UPI001F5AD971|nr:hypothetical protein [Bacillus cereus]
MEKQKELNILLTAKATEVISRSGLKLSVVIKNLPGGLIGGYNKFDSTITINPKQLILSAIEHQLSPEDFLELIVCHELGHAMDALLTEELLKNLDFIKEKLYNKLTEFDELDLNPNREHNKFQLVKKEALEIIERLKNLEYPAEERACQLGRELVAKHLLNAYDNHSKELLKTYLKNYREMIFDKSTIQNS